MKNNQFFIVTVLLSVVCASHVIKAYGDDILKPLHDKIKDEFINRSSAYVARQLRKNKPVSHDFQHFLDNDESIKKMTQTYGDGTGRFAIEVINKKNEIIDDCKCKRDNLNAENETNITKKHTCIAMLGISVIAEAIGLSLLGISTTGSGKQIAAGISGTALLVGVGSWMGWSWCAETQKEKQTHITEITKIEEKWEHNFAEMHKNTKHKHVHPHTTT